MSNILGFYFVFFVVLFCLVPIVVPLPFHVDDGIADKGTKVLFDKEREFLKVQPMSTELKEFIAKIRESRQLQFPTKMKREHTENIGENEAANSLNFIDNNDSNNNNRNDDDDDDDDSLVAIDKRLADSDIDLSQLNLNSLIDLDDTISNNINNNIGEDLLRGVKIARTADSGSSEQPAHGTTTTASNSAQNDAKTTESTTGETTPTAGDEDANVLHKILDEVQNLMESRSASTRKDGSLCNVEGAWLSDAGGVHMDVTFRNSTKRRFHVTLTDRQPPSADGFLCSGNWTMVGQLPFCRSGVVVALATRPSDRHVAAFIGECRVCDGAETVTGTWMLGRSSHDCKDQKVAHTILGDVWRRDSVHCLQKKHLLAIGQNSI